MILVKYRMLFENGCIETLSLEEAEAHGNYIRVEEEVPDEKTENNLIIFLIQYPKKEEIKLFNQFIESIN